VDLDPVEAVLDAPVSAGHDHAAGVGVGRRRHGLVRQGPRSGRVGREVGHGVVTRNGCDTLADLDLAHGLDPRGRIGSVEGRIEELRILHRRHVPLPDVQVDQVRPTVRPRLFAVGDERLERAERLGRVRGVTGLAENPVHVDAPARDR
jgi:hypothetical protein